MSKLTNAELVKNAFASTGYGCKTMEGPRAGDGAPFTGNPAGTCVFFENSICDEKGDSQQRSLCYCGK